MQYGRRLFVLTFSLSIGATDVRVGAQRSEVVEGAVWTYRFLFVFIFLGTSPVLNENAVGSVSRNLSLR